MNLGTDSPLFVRDWDVGGGKTTDINYFKYQVELSWSLQDEYFAWCGRNCTGRFYRFVESYMTPDGYRDFHLFMALESADDAMQFKLIFG